jgi:dihydrofolate reductase
LRVSMIVAATRDEVIGDAGDLPWHLPDDLRRFKALTSGHVVVVGRKTHESIVKRLGKPLPGRISVVVTRDPRPGDGAVVYQPSVGAALSVARAIEEFAGRNEVFVIGGAQVYVEALPSVDRVYLTRVEAVVDGDTRMPGGWLDGFGLVDQEVVETNALRYSLERYERG